MNLSSLLFLTLFVFMANANAGITATYQMSFGEKPGRNGNELYYPSCLDVDSSTGDVIVSDTQNHFIKRFTADGVFLNQWGFTGLGVTVDEVDHIVYAGGGDHRIYKFDMQGNQLAVWGGKGTANGQFNRPRDIAVNQVTRNVYVLDSLNDRIQVFQPDGTFIKSWVDTSLYNPYGIDVDPTGQFVWVANSGGGTGGNPFIRKYDLDGNLLLGFGQIGSTPPNMRWTRGIAVDAVGNVFVAATDVERIHKFEPVAGTQLQVFMGPENDIDGPAHPRAVAVNRVTGHIYAAASYSNRIDHFDPNGVLIDTWGHHDRDGLFLSHPEGMTVDSVNNVLYVADTNSHLIKKFGFDGTFMAQYLNWPFVHRDESSLAFPAALTTDALGNFWALKTGITYPDAPELYSNKYVRRYDSNGNYLSGFAHPDFTQNMHGIAVNPVLEEVYVAQSKLNKVMRFDFNGNLLGEWGEDGVDPGMFKSPGGMVVNPDKNYILVVDEKNNRIQKFTLDGVFISEFGSAGSESGQFKFTDFSNVTLDPQENIYVADTMNHRVQVFDKYGTFITQFGTFGDGPEKFRSPVNVAYANGKLFVLETSAKEVEVYDIAPTMIDTVWIDDSLPLGTTGRLYGTWNWVGTNPGPVSGALSNQSILQSGFHSHAFDRAENRLSVEAGDMLIAYVYLDPANPPSEIMLQWREGGSWAHRAYWGANLISKGVDGTESRRYMGPLPVAGGWVRLEVPAAAVGLGISGKGVNGMAFTLYDGRASWDYIGKSRAATPSPQSPPPPPLPADTDTVWVDDDLPLGVKGRQYGTWNWVGVDPGPVSGTLSHQSVLQAGLHTHSFDRAENRLTVVTGDTLIAYVYLDPANPPTEIMLQWRESGDWNHRAYWGANKINKGVDGTVSRQYMGALPATGGWVRLEVPAADVGLGITGKPLDGMAFSLFDGRATWDYAGKL